MKRAIGITLFFALGAVVGPIFLAAVLAIFPAQTRFQSVQDEEIGLLVKAYQEQLPAGRLFLSVPPPPTGRECGYEPEEIFPNPFVEMAKSHQQEKFSPYEGYRALLEWRDEAEDREFIVAVADRLASDLTRFEAAFLRRCIQSTLLSNICMNKVEAVGSKVARYDPARKHFTTGGGYENKILCAYVDGVAARRGVKLAPAAN